MRKQVLVVGYRPFEMMRGYPPTPGGMMVVQHSDDYSLTRARLADEAEREKARPLLNAWLSPAVDRPEWSREEWIAQFRALGFTSDGYRSTPRDCSVLLRGCRFEGREGLSWTTKFALAEWFARRCGGQVFVVHDVPADRLLARLGPKYSDRQGGEAIEYICDVTAMSISLA